jgi:hypothetical protein
MIQKTVMSLKKIEKLIAKSYLRKFLKRTFVLSKAERTLANLLWPYLKSI